MADLGYGPLTPAWATLGRLAKKFESKSIRELFESDSGRGTRLAREAHGLFLDFSRQRLDQSVLEELLALADQTGVQAAIRKMFDGERINVTEDRAALHVALRRPANRELPLDGEDVMPRVEAERRRMGILCDELAAGRLTGYTGRRITDVVNVGIGGSDLGPEMTAVSLAEYSDPNVSLHFVSNIDGVGMTHVLRDVDPETTLFVICSKSFTTLETLTNANIARSWLLEHGGSTAVAMQVVAVSTNHDAMDAFGVDSENRFDMWDWVGGRYSVWSAVGLSVALAIGRENFERFLSGANEMDEHFLSASMQENLPVLLALIGIWNRNFLGAETHAVLPYDDHLRLLPAYLQQLEMESNGKSVRKNGEPVQCKTCPIIWGEPGSNAQHSFFQLLHQGTSNTSIDFLLPARSGVGRQAQQELAAANCLAQAWSLAEGDPQGRASSPHEAYAGNRSNTLILFAQLDPETLGKIVALYEHKVYVQGIVWDINSFDQWGVQLGKRLAGQLTGEDALDPAPAAISAALEKLRGWREG